MKIKKGEKMTALIVGAGAVENAWHPILRALQPWFDFPLTPDGANSFLARLVYLVRWFGAIPTDYGRAEFRKHVAFLAKIRSAICAELKFAQDFNEIRIRKEFESIVDAMLIRHSRKYMLVTTNWDNVVETALTSYMERTMARFEVRPLHIHGSFKDPNTLYLPTEVTRDSHRSHKEEQEIGGIHGSIWRGLEGANRIVIYGLSLSPLDAELGQTLACGFDSNSLEEVCVVVPDHPQVAHRVNLLLNPRRQVMVRGCIPTDLGKLHDYTIVRPTRHSP